MIETDTSERCQVTEEQDNWLATQPPKLEEKKTNCQIYNSQLHDGLEQVELLTERERELALERKVDKKERM